MKVQKIHTWDGKLASKTSVVGPRVCGKQCYAGKKFAKARAAQMSKELGEPINAYKCNPCHAWHVGHPPGWREAHGREKSIVNRRNR